MNPLPVKGLPSSDSGRLLVRLNSKFRNKIPRYRIVKLTNSDNKKSKTTLVLGHDDDKAIFMPFDIREALDVKKGSMLNFTIHEVTLWGKLCWYVSSEDPAVHVPAWIAIGGLILAITSLFIGMISIFYA